jgi:hypothetical protein
LAAAAATAAAAAAATAAAAAAATAAVAAAAAAAAAVAIDTCAGDVNIFLNDPDDRSTAEVEVMVAEPSSRRRGLAHEALSLFMAFAVCHLGVTRFCAKVGEANGASLSLFEHKLGFVEVGRSAAFKEVVLELPVQGAVRELLTAAGERLQLGVYDAGGDGDGGAAAGTTAAAEQRLT